MPYNVTIDAALKAYEKRTSQNLITHPLATQLQARDSPEAMLTILQHQAVQLGSSGVGDEKLKTWLGPVVNVLYAFSATLGEDVGPRVSPAKAFFAGVGILLLATKDIPGSQDILEGTLESIKIFFGRLERSTEVPPTLEMTENMVKITIEVLDILAIATKKIKRSRHEKSSKKAARRTDLEDGLTKLDQLTNEGARMASAEVQRIANENVRGLRDGKDNTDETVPVAGGDAQILSDNSFNMVGSKTQRIVDGDIEARTTAAEMIVLQMMDDRDDVNRTQLRARIRKWQSPPDPSTNYYVACDVQHKGTAAWLFEDDIFKQWKVAGSLLWINGKPGSGKSVLCSAIISDVIVLCVDGLRSMAYFYFDARDTEKQSCHSLLSSLLTQFSARSDPFCDILSRLYKAHDNGTRQPSNKALTQCLKEMLTLPGRGPVYLILDALDECPNEYGFASQRAQVLDLIKDLVESRLPNLHMCVTSRLEVDIRASLEPLASHLVSLHDRSGQKKDIDEYIRFVVYSNINSAMRTWRDRDKELVIKTLSERANGMFKWVSCQLEMLRHCLPQNIRRVLEDYPRALDETYERMLKEIAKEKRTQAHRLFQCLAVAIRPLRAEELAEVLARDFNKTQGIPELNKYWRQNDPEQFVLSMCCSLIDIVDDHFSNTRFVKFTHFSVKQFLTSNRLNGDLSSFHISPGPAHTIFAQACLGILLQSSDTVDDERIGSHSPLAEYAARHWVGHAQFGDVALHLKDGMQCLFDSDKPHFTAWLKLHDIDDGWNLFGDGIMMRARGTPLYYASLCGFSDLAAHLIDEHPWYIAAVGGLNHSPLVAALHKRHFNVADLLFQHGADVNVRDYERRTPLYAAAAEGSADVVKWLLDHHAEANSVQDGHLTPLNVAVANRHLEVVRVLLEHGTDINAATKDHYTLLHKASENGRLKTVSPLIEHGAEVNAQDGKQSAPLHLASSAGSIATVQLLPNHGADVKTQDGSQSTPLHLASPVGSLEITGRLLEPGANLKTQDRSRSTPLHLASSMGSLEMVRHLLKHGAEVNAHDGNQSTPLHLASSVGSLEIAGRLLEHGADVNAQDGRQSMPLHLASSAGSPDTVQLLIDCGAEVNAHDRSQSTPLHLASSAGSPKTVQLLIDRGAEVNAHDRNQSTPLHLASSVRSLEIVRQLLKHGADINVHDGSQSTPLHLASSAGSPETVQLLLEHGAKVNAKDGSRSTPLHLASSARLLQTVQLLLKHGADVHAQNGSQSTPLHLASSVRSLEIVRQLLKHGAEVSAQDRRQSTPLHLASSVGSLEIIGRLLEHGADVNAHDGSQSTPLHLASFAGSPKTLQLLLKHGAEVNAHDGNQSTPLHFASSAGSPETVKLLLEHGADVHAQDGSQWTPLHFASSSGSLEIVQLLLEHGAEVNAQDESQSTPLHLASSVGSLEIVRKLLEHGADVNAQDESKSTPLHLASSVGSLEIIGRLLEQGAEVNAQDGSQSTPLHLASSAGSPETVQLLIDCGAEVNAQDGSQSTPLHRASSAGSPETVQLLIDCGAEVNAQDGSQSTPLHLASSKRFAETMRLLIDCGANVDAKDKEGQTPLKVAASGTHPNRVIIA